MDREQRQTQGEVRAGEDGERLDKNVGDGLVAREVRVELVAVCRETRAVSALFSLRDWEERRWVVWLQFR